ncbi:MAG: hypothetical protein IKA83_04110 [Paludibacteraceae bacterium]|nr:hypothetical protein [Paludibacteraceae bacterium]
MMKKIVLLFTMVCLGTTMCIADNDGYNSCIIETASGDTIECLAKLNFFSLSYKINPNDKAQKLKPAEVRFATFCENDTCTIWSGLPIVMPDKALKGKTKGMSRGFHHFLVNPKEVKLAISTMVQLVGNVYTNVYFFYKPGDNFCTLAFMPISYDRSSMAKKASQVYMSDCPAIMQYVQNKKTHIKEMDDFYSLYNEYMNCVED